MFEFPIKHPLFAPQILQKPLFSNATGSHFQRAFEDNNLCKIWGANTVYYGEFENS